MMTATYGNCYSFNYEFNQHDKMKGKRQLSLTGPSYGLSLVLNLDQGNYMQKGYSKQAGARLVLSPTNGSILFDEAGMDVQPNRLVHLTKHS